MASPTVTGLRPLPRDRVAVELDDEPWRTLPASVVVGAGLREGLRLDRPLARLLRTELRRAESLRVATRALARRDHTRASLQARLARGGAPDGQSGEALDLLERAGLLDDRRFALARAEALAARGAGDLLVRATLVRDGVATGLVDEAVGALDPEPERARRIVAARGAGLKTLRLLARKGFSEDTLGPLADQLAAGDFGDG